MHEKPHKTGKICRQKVTDTGKSGRDMPQKKYAENFGSILFLQMPLFLQITPRSSAAFGLHFAVVSQFGEKHSCPREAQFYVFGDVCCSAAAFRREIVHNLPLVFNGFGGLSVSACFFCLFFDKGKFQNRPVRVELLFEFRRKPSLTFPYGENIRHSASDAFSDADHVEYFHQCFVFSSRKFRL